MRAPVETIYVNPNVNQGDASLGNIPKSTSHSPVVYGDNPNITTNEFGETVVVQNPESLTPPLTPKEQAQQLVDDIKEAVANNSANPTEPKKDFGTIIKDNKALRVAKTNPAPVKPKTNYLLYGLLGVGAVIMLLGLTKKK
jgi:hypothetical protein